MKTINILKKTIYTFVVDTQRTNINSLFFMW
jgi:hypothetical protein